MSASDETVGDLYERWCYEKWSTDGSEDQGVEDVWRDAFKAGWNAALNHVRATNGEGARHYL